MVGPVSALTLRYGERSDQVIDVYMPAEASPHPLVIFFHGGFWRPEWDRAHLAPLAQALPAAGVPVAIPEYRRSGGWLPMREDVSLVAREAPRLIAAATGLERSVVLAGHSAGGHLALWVAGQPGVTAAAVVALAPVADLRRTYELDLDGGAVRDLLGGGPDQVAQRYAEADPIARVPLAVPVTLLHGTRDLHVPLSLSQRYLAAATAAGGTAHLYELDAAHFDVIDPASAVWPAVVAALTLSPIHGTNPG